MWWMMITDHVGDTVTMDVVNGVTVKGTSEAIVKMVTMTIMLTTAPENVTISWMMTTNDDKDNEDNSEDGKDDKDFLPMPTAGTTAQRQQHEER